MALFRTLMGILAGLSLFSAFVISVNGGITLDSAPGCPQPVLVWLQTGVFAPKLGNEPCGFAFQLEQNWPTGFRCPDGYFCTTYAGGDLVIVQEGERSGIISLAGVFRPKSAYPELTIDELRDREQDYVNKYATFPVQVVKFSDHQLY